MKASNTSENASWPLNTGQVGPDSSRDTLVALALAVETPSRMSLHELLNCTVPPGLSAKLVWRKVDHLGL